MTFQSINPATNEVIATYQVHSEEEIKASIDKAHAAFKDWRLTTMEHRAACLKRAAEILRDNKQEYALLMTREMGKPINQALMEIEKCASACDHYANHSAEYLAQENVETNAAESFICYEPMGLILAIMPWNFPFWQVFRFAAPALMAGNGCLLKHAPNVIGCALAVEELFRQAGLPSGLFTTLIAETESVEAMIANPYVSAVTLTGSCAAGSAVASLAGKYLKKSVLELGGSDPYVVLADADIELAAKVCTASRMNNNGQVCIAAKRLIVEEPVVAEFEKRLLEEMTTYTPGNPELETTTQGPMARQDLLDNIQRQVNASIEQGARCILGGTALDGQGFYYPATVLTDVTQSMTAFREELFGPVACIITAKDEDHAIELANDSEFGLGGAVFSRDIDKAKEIASHRIDTGTCVVNDLVLSDPRLPFGGIKQSGYGRELSHFGIREFVNIKTVYTS